MGGPSIGVNNQSFEIGMPESARRRSLSSSEIEHHIVRWRPNRPKIERREGEREAPGLRPDDDEGRVCKRVIRWCRVNGGRTH